MAKKTLDKSAGIDIQIAGGMVVAGLASEQGLQSIQQVIQGAKDVPNALGHVIFMAIDHVREKLQQNGVNIDDRVWLANKGVVDRILFEVVGLLYGVVGYKQAADPNFVHALKDSIVTLMEHADGAVQGDDEASESMPDDEMAEEQGMDEESVEQGAPDDEQAEGETPQGMLAPRMGMR